MKAFLLAALCYICYSAPLPVPLEEEFNLPGFNAKQENHGSLYFVCVEMSSHRATIGMSALNRLAKNSFGIWDAVHYHGLQHSKHFKLKKRGARKITPHSNREQSQICAKRSLDKFQRKNSCVLTAIRTRNWTSMSSYTWSWHTWRRREEFDSLDKDKDGIVTQKEYEEHYHGVTSRSEARRSEYFAKVFQDFDEDFDMSLNQDEMERVLAERFLVKPRENFPKLFYSFDHDHSGGLDLTEYMKFDAEFPFDQTDPITGDVSKKQKPAGRKNSNRGPAVPISAQLDGRDAEAVAQVMAQASPTLAKVGTPCCARLLHLTPFLPGRK
ncbi:EF hand [Ancylostoma caninum]|uniref:EF hand n=1 Tax=Ancylostoma caninum TaxID=29170 RepID=A0A368FJW2_ANCCA|nr:EF hand [Ancylostoma caninum]